MRGSRLRRTGAGAVDGACGLFRDHRDLSAGHRARRKLLGIPIDRKIDLPDLERPYREVLILRDLEGLSGEETAAALGLELATMKTRLRRARGRLRERLSASGYSAPRSG